MKAVITLEVDATDLGYLLECMKRDGTVNKIHLSWDDKERAIPVDRIINFTSQSDDEKGEQ